jgi:hypothetical protein
MEKENRHVRRANQKLAKKHQAEVSEVATLACQIFKTKESATAWLYEENQNFQGCSPLEFILLGRGLKVISFLKERIVDE